MLRSLCLIIVFMIASLLVASIIPVDRLHYTCMVCRMSRLETRCLGFGWPRLHPTECSEWYSKHVEPEHAHLWERGTCQYTSNLLGMPMMVGCSPGRYPILLLPPVTQMHFYQQFKNPLEAKTLFENLTDEKTHNDRLDGDDEDRGHLTIQAIKEWESEGYSGTWDEFWQKFYAGHVQEHQETQAWLQADSGLGFQEWKAQRTKSQK